MSISLKSTVKLRSGAAIPQLGYGVYQARGDECEKGVAEALRVGYTHIDSAQAYRNEKLVVGDNVSDRSSTYLTTKYMPTHQHHSSSAVYDYLVKSVPKLNKGKSIEEGGYIDLMLIHAPFGGEKGRTENWAALARAQKEGWIKDIGVSNFGVKHLQTLPEPVPAINQIEIHPWCQQRPIVEYCQKHGIVLQAYSPLSRATKERMEDKTVVRIGEKYGKDWAQILVRWSLQKGYIPLPKSVTPSRIKSNSEVYDFELDKDDMAALDGLDEGAKGASTWNPVDAD